MVQTLFITKQRYTSSKSQKWFHLHHWMSRYCFLYDF